MIRSTLLTAGFFAWSAHAQSNQIICWGGEHPLVCESPSDIEFISIQAGREVSAALTTSGSIFTWGHWENYEEAPGGSQSFVDFDLSKDNKHGVALRSDGSIESWGFGPNGETNNPTDGTYLMVSAGNAHQIALSTEGDVVGWGNNAFGQSNSKDGEFFVFIDAGGNHNIGIKNDGTVSCWGYNASGQSNVPADLGLCTQASGGGAFSLVLRVDGSLAAWGSNSSGQCDVPSGNDFIKIQAGNAHAVALRQDGTIACWGNNASGQSSCTSGNYIDVSAGHYHSLGLVEPEAQTRCCLGGTCIEMSQIDCINYGGTDAGEGSCATDTCTSNGACCLPSQCVEVGMQDCFELGGSFAGFGTNCSDTQCTFACEGDVSGNGTVDFTDLLILINNWGACPS